MRLYKFCLSFGVIVAGLPVVAEAANVGGGAQTCALPRTSVLNTALDAAFRPDLLYGDRISFEVRRNGDPVGRHETRFVMDNGLLRVTSEMALKVKVLFVTAYTFTYDTVSSWCGNTLTSLTARVNDNGKTKDIRAAQMPAGLRIDGPAGQFAVDGPLFPTEHWNPAVLKDNRVLNTLTGKVATVQITDKGDDLVETKTGMIPARHYTYSGDFSADVWYDKAGRWVKLQFVTKKDKSVIDYICETCQFTEAVVSTIDKAPQKP